MLEIERNSKSLTSLFELANVLTVNYSFIHSLIHWCCHFVEEKIDHNTLQHCWQDELWDEKDLGKSSTCEKASITHYVSIWMQNNRKPRRNTFHVYTTYTRFIYSVRIWQRGFYNSTILFTSATREADHLRGTWPSETCILRNRWNLT